MYIYQDFLLMQTRIGPRVQDLWFGVSPGRFGDHNRIPTSISDPSPRPTSYNARAHNWEALGLRMEEGRLGSWQQREADAGISPVWIRATFCPYTIKPRKKTTSPYCTSASSTLLRGPMLGSGWGIICH